jgi:hypothetical protein
MNYINKNFKSIAGIIFLVVGFGHGLRASLGWQLLIDAWNVPIWLSAVTAIILLTLSYVALFRK